MNSLCLMMKTDAPLRHVRRVQPKVKRSKTVAPFFLNPIFKDLWRLSLKFVTITRITEINLHFHV